MRFILAAVLLNMVVTGFGAENLCPRQFEAEPSEVKSEEQSALPPTPPQLDLPQTFESLVDWIHKDLIDKRGAPGFLIGLSGTDSILVFLAAAKAFQRAGHPSRVVGIHYGDLQDSWFAQEIVPWLRQAAPGAKILVERSVAKMGDGARWGALMDWSVLQDPLTGIMRPPDQRFWVMGTRNATEDALGTYSNISTAASVQPIMHLWKSEVLSLSRFLGVPNSALERSCQVDCACGRHELAGLNISEIDAILMTQRGLLSPTYVENNVPPDLLVQLSNYIEQLRTGNFKKNIPYAADSSLRRMEDANNLSLYFAAKRSITEAVLDTRPISRAVPDIVNRGLATLAADLVNAPGLNRNVWFGEALALFNTPGLNLNQQRQMLASLYGESQLKVTDVKRLSKLNGRLGNYSFLFPQWRFLTQRYRDKKSLVEQFGMRRLTRANDVRDSKLAVSDPNRDEWGNGFVWTSDKLTVEYRRAYVLASLRDDGQTTTVVIRNNSYYFGRDRLDESAYVSWVDLDSTKLEQLQKRELDDIHRFVPLGDLLRSHPEISAADKIKRLTALVDSLDDFNHSFDQWVKGDGFDFFRDFLRAKFFAARDNGGPAIFLTTVFGSTPTWFPSKSFPLNEQLLEALNTKDDFLTLIDAVGQNHRLVMVSGADGDYP